MTHVAATRRPSAAARRAGYVLAAVVNSVLLYLVNVRPGWQAVPFLTEDADRVVGLFNVSLATGIVANLVYGLHDPDWLRSSVHQGRTTLAWRAIASRDEVVAGSTFVPRTGTQRTDAGSGPTLANVLFGRTCGPGGADRRPACWS